MENVQKVFLRSAPEPKLNDLVARNTHPTCTDDVPDLCCTSLLLLKRCLIRTAHPP